MIERNYTIRLAPRGKGRPVFSRAMGRARTPETTRSWEAEAAWQLREQHGDVACLDHVGPMWEVEVRAYHQRPKVRPGYLPRALWVMPDYRLMATSRFDLDNIVKITLDSLQMGRVIENDRCIVSIVATSWFANTGEEPRVEVVLREVRV